MGDDEPNIGPLFESRRGSITVRLLKRAYSFTLSLGVLLIWAYRASHIPASGEGRWRWWAWIGAFAAELWFGFYWFLTLAARWQPVYRRTFPQRLSHRFEDKLPGVDVFVCTADPLIEPPIMVINTVLSAMAYDYPPDKLGVYLSDDGGSNLTFYALLEASHFTKIWIPFCKKFKVEPRSPAAYFSEAAKKPNDGQNSTEWKRIKNLYKEMESRINAVAELGEVSEEIQRKHKGFSEWNSDTTSRNHPAIVQILIDGRDESNCDSEGCALPTLVYMAREKRPHYHHNFKAGAMNALLRVSSEITNGAVVLNVDCDMYSNNAESVRSALCFFMDEQKGHEIAYVQCPQNFDNITKNDLYASSLRIIAEVDFHGLDGLGGPLYIGSGCFHRRESLCGKNYAEARKELGGEKPNITIASTSTLEETGKKLASCKCEENTQWGKEMGLKYGSPVEDVITGLSIQCRGWKSVYYNPQRKAFLGVGPMTLAQTLIQHKRWSEGDFQIFISKYCPFLYGHKKISLGLQMCYSVYCLWPGNSLPLLYYVVVPPLCLLKGTSLFPGVSDMWSNIPFTFVIGANYVFSLVESLYHGETLLGWWNDRRIWVFKRTTSYLFAFIDSMLKVAGVSKSTFVITAKVVDDEASKRYEEETMEFGAPSPMFTILATIAMLNLVCFGVGVKRIATGEGDGELLLQFVICCWVFLLNIPVYDAMFFRSDSGSMPSTTTLTSVLLVVFAYVITML